MANKRYINWSNPDEIDLHLPYIYFIRINSGKQEYRYVGKGSSPSRMEAYNRNVSRVLAGEPKRPVVKRNGDPQSEGNIKFRYVHLILAVAASKGWAIEHYPIENCSKVEHAEIEKQRISEFECNMNNGNSWFVEAFEQLAKSVK